MFNRSNRIDAITNIHKSLIATKQKNPIDRIGFASKPNFTHIRYLTNATNICLSQRTTVQYYAWWCLTVLQHLAGFILSFSSTFGIHPFFTSAS